jgi:hypothetical protein
MGFFKLGVGYRLTPRSEAVLTFVIERSSAETANIGTVSAANVPLNVDFEDYNYWGFEGGQRFYFARARFTPYVGYLVGINRELGIVAFLKGNIGAAPTLMQPAYQAAEQSGDISVSFSTWARLPTGSCSPPTLRSRGGRWTEH